MYVATSAHDTGQNSAVTGLSDSHKPSQGMNTNLLFVYSRDTRLAGSRPRSVNIFCQKRADELCDFRSIFFQREVSRV
jgi:hypothetical protein